MGARLKYGNVPTTIGGERFSSKREALRWLVLKDMVKHGEIIELVRQPEFKLKVNGKLICKYRGDFGYAECRSPRYIVEDSKGYQTKDWKIKWALCKALFPDIEWRLS